MSQPFAPSLRSVAASGLVILLATCSDLLLPVPSLADQAPRAACQDRISAQPAAEPRPQAAGPINTLLLAQALPSAQAFGIDPGLGLGLPTCTYEPPLPTKPLIIRGLW